jgi:CRISPR-associated endonuclease/helicase Cas3
MRVLAEQTEGVVREALRSIDRLWDGSNDHAERVGVHLLMGGADPGGDWTLYPEECAVLIGTQDMLLSRALNRGYATGRARWPLEFGLLSHDALWVLDEVQLMDVGLATSAQLQAFHDEDAPKGFRPRISWWMSATLQPAWLEGVDTRAQHPKWIREPVALQAAKRRQGLGAIRKQLQLEEVSADDAETFAQRCLDAHGALADGEHGRITLVVCNTVERACATFDALCPRAPQQEVKLVHSRFRGAERANWREEFLSRKRCTSGADRIVVATQVVEAGVDISAGAVVTEFAPWSSLVQRFGRCARYGGKGTVTVVDRGRDDESALPYWAHEIEEARNALDQMRAEGGDVGTAPLEEFEEALDADQRRKLYPYQPRHLLLRREFVELFDTTPDLTGADLDVSRFIRSGQERDLQVFWLNVPASKEGEPPARPPRRRRPMRDELCAVPFLRARDWLCGRESKSSRMPRLRNGMRAWVWDWIEGDWVGVERAMLMPGRVVCVASDCGGYRLERGFDAESSELVPEVRWPLSVETEAQLADESDDGEELSTAPWKTIASHGREVAGVAAAIASGLALPERLRELLALGGRWHDLGKAHLAFQGAIRGSGRPARADLAKAPTKAWLKPRGTYRTADDRETRRGLRHELASMLALFAVLRRCQPSHPALLGPWAEALRVLGCEPPAMPTADPTPTERDVIACSADEFDLLAYLVLCHHGKVRMALYASPKDQEFREPGDGRGLPIRGVREGDMLPSVILDSTAPLVPEIALTLAPASVGLSPVTGRSWGERTSALLDRFGPGALAWFEALIIAADRRASRLNTSDPLLSAPVKP